jgi:hypothetical protein
LNVSGITTLNNKTIINGIAEIHGGAPGAVPNNYMQSGRLTIGDENLNHGRRFMEYKYIRFNMKMQF